MRRRRRRRKKKKREERTEKEDEEKDNRRKKKSDAVKGSHGRACRKFGDQFKRRLVAIVGAEHNDLPVGHVGHTTIVGFGLFVVTGGQGRRRRRSRKQQTR